MNEWQTDESGADTKQRYIVLAVILLIGGLILVGVGVIKPVAEAQADREASRAYAIAAQSQAQIQQERERTERSLAEQQTVREAARLRAEQVGAGLIIIGAISAFGVVITGAVALAYGLDRVIAAAEERRAREQERRHERLLVYAAQINQLAAPTQLALPREVDVMAWRRDVRDGRDRWILRVGRVGGAAVGAGRLQRW